MGEIKSGAVEVCCICEEAIVGFVVFTDSRGKWCDACIQEYTCEECGTLEDDIVSNGLCQECEENCAEEVEEE